jgi:hypothetical protein
MGEDAIIYESWQSGYGPAVRKGLTILLRQVGKGVGQASRLTTRQGDAGAMPRTATVLVNGKGIG